MPSGGIVQARLQVAAIATAFRSAKPAVDDMMVRRCRGFTLFVIWHASSRSNPTRTGPFRRPIGLATTRLRRCSPALFPAESLRFISLPTTLDWYAKHVFDFQRKLMKAVRPLVNRLGPVEAPPDSYFGNIQDLFQKIQGIDTVLEDPAVTSVRLVTNAEKMVLRETQRAFVYFSLHGLTVDGVIVNRVLPEEIADPFFTGWRESQSEVLHEIDAYFAPVPVARVPLFHREVRGYEGLLEVSERLYPEGVDPAAVRQLGRPYSYARQDDHYEVRLQMPFVQKGEIGLFKKRDELVVEIGTLRRHVGLPTTMANLVPTKARMDGNKLVVEMRSTA